MSCTTSSCDRDGHNASVNKDNNMPAVYKTLAEVWAQLNGANQGNALNLLLEKEPSGALVRPGEYVLYPPASCEMEEEYPFLVGQIINIADYRDIPGEEIRFHDEDSSDNGKKRFVLVRLMESISYDGHQGQATKPTVEKYPCVPESLKEVRRTGLMHWIDAKSILSIAFVFHIDQVNACKYSCAGITNAFFIRQEIEDDMTITMIDGDEFDPFDMPWGIESYSKRMWNFISSVKEMCWRSMTSSKSVWDGRTKHVHFPGVNFECMQYLKFMMRLSIHTGEEPGQLCEDKMTVTRAKKVCHPNLSISHKKRKFDVSLIRVVDEDELDLVSSVFGSTFGIGLTHSAPSIKAIKTEMDATGKDISTVELQEHQLVRIVTCRPDEVDEVPERNLPSANETVEDDAGVVIGFEPYDKSPPQKRWLPYPGCDFFYEQSTMSNFHVALRFKKLKASASTVAKAQWGGGEGRISVPSNTTVSPQTEFRYGPDGAVYSVRRVVDGRVKCKLTYEDSDDSDIEELDLPVEEVVQLVKQHNNLEENMVSSC
jgi:hypothetical protein